MGITSVRLSDDLDQPLDSLAKKLDPPQFFANVKNINASNGSELKF